MPNTPPKIAIVAHSLAHGGAERSSALLSQMLSDAGFEVHFVTVIDSIEYEYGGTLFNLGTLKTQDDSTLGRFKRLIAFRKYLNKQQFDWVIDNRTRQSWWSEWIISRWIYHPAQTIYVVRSSNIADYFPSKLFIARSIYKTSPFIVAVSDGIKHAIEQKYDYNNVVRIYNAFAPDDAASATRQLPDQPFIVAYGRINDRVKNYSLMIDAYRMSKLNEKGVKLYILGDGKDVGCLKDKVADLNLSDDVLFIPRVSDPSIYVKSALFTALSSRYEGFPRVLIESLNWGTPVVSVDCFSGPSEIIQNERNGLLVPNNDPAALADAMYQLATDTELYDICKQNAQSSVVHLSPEAITAQWQNLLIRK